MGNGGWWSENSEWGLEPTLCVCYNCMQIWLCELVITHSALYWLLVFWFLLCLYFMLMNMGIKTSNRFSSYLWGSTQFNKTFVPATQSLLMWAYPTPRREVMSSITFSSIPQCIHWRHVSENCSTIHNNQWAQVVLSKKNIYKNWIHESLYHIISLNVLYFYLSSLL